MISYSWLNIFDFKNYWYELLNRVVRSFLLEDTQSINNMPTLIIAADS